MTGRELRRISVSRVMGFIITVSFAGAAIYFAVESYAAARNFDEWLVAEPVNVEVDLSRIGVIESPFNQTCQISHGESILLNVADAPPDVNTLLTGLDGTLAIVDADGKSVVSASLARWHKSDSVSTDASIVLADFLPFSNGDYTMRLEVTKPAIGLSKYKQRVHARYLLCGLEEMPAFILGVFAVGSGIVALLAGVICIPLSSNSGVKVTPPPTA